MSLCPLEAYSAKWKLSVKTVTGSFLEQHRKVVNRTPDCKTKLQIKGEWDDDPLPQMWEALVDSADYIS